MTVPLSFSGKAQATYLATEITDINATSFTVVSASTWTETVPVGGSNYGQPLGTSGPFVLTLDYGLPTEEKVLCTAVNTTTGVVTGVTRAYDGTTARTHVSAAANPVVHTYSSDTPYEASSAYTKTTAITAGTAGAVPVATLGSGALPSGVTVPTAQISSGALPTGVTASKTFSGSTSVTSVTGYNNYMIIATAAYNNATLLDQITQSLTVNGLTNKGTATAILTTNSSQPNIISLTSVYAYATTPSTSFTVSLVGTSSNGTATQSLQNIQIIGYN